MAANIKRRVALKGQSRSKFCGEPIKRGSKIECLRLVGHKKAHRATMARRPSAPAPEVLVIETPKAGLARRARRAEVLEGSGRAVKVLAEAGPKGRDVQVQRSARRAKAAPQGRQISAIEAVVARSAKPKAGK